ncbi:MAG: hypothetical protein QNI85_05480 [Desulfobacterales bacterium]|nr:hypothetical protein [Desulfobacterales bacterium]
MKIKIQTYLLILGMAGLLALPADARSGDGHGQTSDVLLAGSNSLVVTNSQAPAAAPEAPLNGTPELVVEVPMYYFGRVLDGTEVAHEFLIANKGSGDLAIDKVVTG